MTGHDPELSLSVRRRVLFCAFVLLCGFGVVMARAVHLQVLQADKLGGMARDQWLRQVELTPRRGPIVDAQGVPLAVSVEAESFFLDATKAEGLPVKKLAEALRVERSFLEKRLREKRSFAWLVRRAGPEISHAMRRLREDPKLSEEARKALEAVSSVREYRRFYPQKHLAAHLLGLVGMDEQGLEGLELDFDSVLRGEAQEVAAFRDVRGNRLLAEPAMPSTALVGAKVELTIDSSLQHVAEESLAKGVAAAKARAGVVVVTEPASGAILAMATWPRFNANGRATAAERRNRVVTDAWEPGSTVKSFTYAAAMSDGLVKPQTMIEVGDGKLRFGRTTIGDSHRPDEPVISATEAMATSSNVAIAKLGLKMGGERLLWWLERFGFGERTGIGLPGEARGRLQAKLGEIATATTSFGQGMTATPLQLSAALGALANGGVLMRPVLVRRVTAADGTVLRDTKPEPVRQVVSAEVAKAVGRMMVAVTKKGGTGTLAAIEGVEVAGKTGTAQKVDPLGGGYSKDKRFSSFMGFAPAGAPRVAVYVGIDEPQGKEIYGGQVAAPIFREVTVEALRRMGVATEASGRALDVAAAKQGEAAAGRKAEPTSQFEEGFVDDAGAALAAGVPGGRVVPDVSGQSVRSARRVLAQAGFDVEIEGSGRVAVQKPPAGTAAEPGAAVRLVLKTGRP